MVHLYGEHGIRLEKSSVPFGHAVRPGLFNRNNMANATSALEKTFHFSGTTLCSRIRHEGDRCAAPAIQIASAVTTLAELLVGSKNTC